MQCYRERERAEGRRRRCGAGRAARNPWSTRPRAEGAGARPVPVSSFVQWEKDGKRVTTFLLSAYFSLLW
ncbi:MAG: hypothetical protein U5P10_16550 [Spirochaetia bacterium]|nr:hypothetical protein [Spirochaetia bacterium]